MSTERAPRQEPGIVNPGTPPGVPERWVKREEMEVATTASGPLLDIPERLNE